MTRELRRIGLIPHGEVIMSSILLYDLLLDSADDRYGCDKGIV